MDISINNILLNQVYKDGERISLREVFPFLPESSTPLVLNLGPDGKLYWALPSEKTSLQSGKGIILSKTASGSLRIDVSIGNPWEGMMCFHNGQIGVGREPLYSYNFDIAVSENRISTAFHIGDGKRGFSMGNGTSNGFLPEIIGMGYSEQDAGLYLLGRAGNGKSSDIPLIILDGRNSEDSYLTNRPIFGITSAKYDNYHLIVDYNGKIGIGKKPEIYKVEVDGEISASDFILAGSSILALIGVIEEQQGTIDRMKDQIQQLLDKK